MSTTERYKEISEEVSRGEWRNPSQPKFKFDDVVQRPDSKDGFSFRITQIQKHKGEFLYSHVGGDWHREDSLEPVKEPRKKKLYAYRIDLYGFSGGADINGDEVRFTPNIEMVSFGQRGSNDWVRAPEYDIEYPEAK